MSEKQSPEAFYASLKEKLEETSTWPSVYLYKFIVPGSNEKIAQIEEIFDNLEAEISTKNSSKGTYTSVSVKVIMASPEAVIEKYKTVGEVVKGVIAL